MRKLTIALLTALTLTGGVLVPTAPLAADDCIESCNRDFPGGSPILISIRGWCYIIRCSL